MERILKEEIIELRNKGLKYKEIREILKCTMSVISYHCRNAGLSQGVKSTIPSKEEIQELNKKFNEGRTIRELARETGRARDTIKKYIISSTKKKRYFTPSENVVNWRKRTKIELVKYKGGRCSKCGYDKCTEALAFHHLDPLDKDFTISGKSWSIERLKKEVDKCILVCSNCHIEIHTELKSLSS